MKHEYVEQNQVVDRYLMDKLRPEEVDKFEQHYLYCESCQNELALSNKFMQGLRQATNHSMPAILEKNGFWQTCRGLVERPAFAAAATVLIAVGITSNLVSLRLLADARTQLTNALAPQSNTSIVLLSPMGSSRAIGTSLQPLTLGDSPAWVVLAMELPKVSSPRYRAALRDPQAQTLWWGDNLLPNSNDEIVVTVHSSQLATGDYSLHVEGLKSDDSWAPVANYTFHAERIVRIKAL